MQPFLMSVLLNGILSGTTKTNAQRRVLRNFPNCGELGNEGNKECIWDCDWTKIPDTVNENNGPFSTSNYISSTECIRDCPSVKNCLSPAQITYDQLKESGETNGTVIFQTLYVPYYTCLLNASTFDGRVIDSISRIVFDSCVVQFQTTTIGFPCIDEFLDGFEGNSYILYIILFKHKVPCLKNLCS